MADKIENNSPTPDPPSLEDPDTAAARKELRETVISEKSANQSTEEAHSSATNAQNESSEKTKTPEPDTKDVENDYMKEQVSSPKKKRAHDEVDELKDAPQSTNGETPSDRSEPEKKRHRDISSESKAGAVVTDEASNPAKSESERSANETSKESEAAAKGDDKAKPKTEDAFKKSGLSGFASSASPFLQAGAPKLTSFGGASSSSASPFAAQTSSDSTPSIFGASSTAANGNSPFATLGGPKPFGGSVFGGGFGSSLSGSKLTSFAKPGATFGTAKAAKPFGAPESDAEDGEDDDQDNEDGGADDEDNEKKDEKEPSEEKSTAGDDKKKPKLQQVEVDTGEAGEATIIQVRAKIYHLDKTSGWKERGAGNLKINVPKTSVDFDADGQVRPGSFDASALEDDSHIVRLVMRQDSTHRVILNTVLFPAMEFTKKSTAKAQCILFTAFEGDGGEAVSIQVKLSQINAESFLNEVDKIQHELQSV